MCAAQHSLYSFSRGFLWSFSHNFMEDTLIRRSWIATLQRTSLWSSSVSNSVTARETCPYLSTPALSRERRSVDGQQQQEGFAKLLLDSRASISHNAKHNYANFFFFFFPMRTRRNNGFNICPYLQQVFCMQMRWGFRDGEAECLLHPSFVARRIMGDLLWFVNMRAFDSDWNETMCRIRLKTMCGEWRLRHVLDFTRPYASARHCGPIVWPGLLLWSGFLSCFCSVMGYNNLYKSHWLSWSSTVWAWHWWKAWFLQRTGEQKVLCMLRESLKVSGL